MEIVKENDAGQKKKYKQQHKDKPEEEELKEGEKKTRTGLPRVTVPPICKVCDGPLTIGGPIWNHPIHDAEFAKRLMKAARNQTGHIFGTTKRIQAILTGIIDEEPLQDEPLNYDINFICSSLRSANPSKQEFVYALTQQGYKTVQTYYNSRQWKTNAPPEVLYNIFKAYKLKQYDGDMTKVLTNLKPGSPGYRIFNKLIPGPEIDFDFKSATKEDGKIVSKKKQKKYYENPAPNWGPKPRATGK